jgi:protein O-GlcNAc transferase
MYKYINMCICLRTSFVSLVGLTDEDAARRIVADGVHVLVDLTGYTRGQRLSIFAWRAAPVQVAYKGYAGTTGLPEMDFIVADAAIARPPYDRAEFSERVVRLPRSFFVNDFRQRQRSALRAREDRPPRSEVPALDGDPGFVFCNFGKAYKVDPALADAWAEILRRTAHLGSRMWMIDLPRVAAENVRAELLRRGVEPASRVVRSPLFPKAQHLAIKSHCDLFLDTVQYNAHGTAAEMLWAGVPVLTVPGPRMTARVAASLVRGAGLGARAVDTLVQGSLEAYVETAVRLASDEAGRAELAAIRAELEAARDSAPLFDTRGWVADFERALQAMWEVRAARGVGRPMAVAM